MKLSFLRFALATAFCAAPLMAVAAPLPVKTRLGVAEGVAGRTAGVAAFKGIPFAAPPVGELRWRAPQAAKPWTGVLKADHFSPHCAQNIVDTTGPWTREFMPHGETSEDCLYLNVWTAAKSNAEKRPVFFYIHGGAFTGGSGAVALYDGEGLAGKGLVVVTVNYRVGPFGFFAHPELTRESGRNASGNQGLLDVVAALEWVRDNIAAFGGDPGNVTIAGQSAGSSAVHCLLASPLAKGLFHRAVAQSGGSTLGGNERKLADAEAEGVRFAQARGASTLAELRKLTPAQLLATQGAATRSGPIVDGYLLPAPIAEIVAQGKQNDVPILTGATADEGGASPAPTTTLEAFQRQAQRFGETFARLYPAASNAEAGQANNASSRDQQRVNINLWAQARAKTSKAKIYTYFWTHAMPGPDAARLGAFHSSELAYMFRTLYMSDRPFNAEDQRIAEEMSSYWANFARAGNPNGKGLPAWPSTAEQPDATMQLGDKAGAVPLAGSPEKLAFWRETLARRK